MKWLDREAVFTEVAALLLLPVRLILGFVSLRALRE
jgi:hypothetical protein